MTFLPLVVTDSTDSRAVSSESIPRTNATFAHLDGFQYVHCAGIPHRSSHVEILNANGAFFIWERKDGRLEIPGGHLDWLTEHNRPETYEEAARRETVEELELEEMFGSFKDAMEKLHGGLVPVEKVINQIPSSHVNNNEWVTVYRLHWQSEWPDPCEHLRTLAKTKAEKKFEGKAESATWMSLETIKEKGILDPMKINAALRLLLRRRGIMVPVLLTEYFKKYDDYRAKTCPPAT